MTSEQKKKLLQVELALDTVQQLAKKVLQTTEQINQSIVDDGLKALEYLGIKQLNEQNREKIWSSTFKPVYSVLKKSGQQISQLQQQTFEILDNHLDVHQTLTEKKPKL